jgi:hypothetical protein
MAHFRIAYRLIVIILQPDVVGLVLYPPGAALELNIEPTVRMSDNPNRIPPAQYEYGRFAGSGFRPHVEFSHEYNTDFSGLGLTGAVSGTNQQSEEENEENGRRA